MPIQSALRFTLAPGLVEIHAWNGQMDFGGRIEVGDQQHSGVAFLPGRPLLRFLQAAERGSARHVDLDISDHGRVEVTAGDAVLEMRLVESEAWPDFRRTPSRVAISAADVVRIRSVLFAASADSARGAVTGIRLDAGLATATDNERLARARLDCEIPSCLVPAHVLREAMRGPIDPLFISVDESRVVLEDAQGFWATSVLAGEYPDASVERLLALSVIQSIEFDLDQLRSALDYVSVFASPFVELHAKDGKARLRIVECDLGSVESVVSAEFHGEMSVGFNRVHLTDAVEHHDLPRIGIGLSGIGKPAQIHGDRVEQCLTTRAAT